MAVTLSSRTDLPHVGNFMLSYACVMFHVFHIHLHIAQEMTQLKWFVIFDNYLLSYHVLKTLFTRNPPSSLGLQCTM